MAKKRMIDTSVPEHLEEVGPSRTKLRAERKQIQATLDALTRRLESLPTKKLAKLMLEPELDAAVRMLGTIAQGSALSRQRKLVSRLLRSEDVAGLAERVEELAGERGQNVHAQRLERWRERLAAQGDGALSELLEIYPGANRQQLRQAIRAAVTERAAGSGNRHWKELYRVLRDLGEPAPPPSTDDEAP